MALDLILPSLLMDSCAFAPDYAWAMTAPSKQRSCRSGRASHPLDIVETKDAFQFALEAPGFKPDEIAIDLKEDQLTISGKQAVSEEAKAEDGRVVRRESRRREFSRSFELPANVRGDEVTASLEHGILHVNVPKAAVEAPKSRRIAVTSAAAAPSQLTATPAEPAEAAAAPVTDAA